MLNRTFEPVRGDVEVELVVAVAVDLGLAVDRPPLREKDIDVQLLQYLDLFIDFDLFRFFSRENDAGAFVAEVVHGDGRTSAVLLREELPRGLRIKINFEGKRKIVL